MLRIESSYAGHKNQQIQAKLTFRTKTLQLKEEDDSVKIKYSTYS